jgi:hypothetical protein
MTLPKQKRKRRFTHYCQQNQHVRIAHIAIASNIPGYNTVAGHISTSIKTRTINRLPTLPHRSSMMNLITLAGLPQTLVRNQYVMRKIASKTKIKGISGNQSS